ncbi:MAG: mannose-1-phosphate guanylyltransferase [Armatimonadota bacterium]
MPGSTEVTRIGVIMAGGVGERFWPISTDQRPKQLLPLGPGGRTLLEDTVYRLRGLIADECLMIATTLALRAPIMDAGVSVPPEQIIAEPARRNTMGAIAWTTAWVLGRLGRAPGATTIAWIPADQHVGDVDAFREDISLAMRAAEELDSLVTVGIPPTRPETGYGYIEVGSELVRLGDGSAADGRLRGVVRFREKPDFATAAEFLRRGHFLWNGGMFFWRISTFLDELARAAPQVAELTAGMAEALAAGDDAGAERLFAELPDTSVDYALMERAQRVIVVRAGFPWDDLGAWDAWRRVEAGDEAGNVTLGRALLIDCRGCAVYSDPGEGPQVAVVGLDGVVVAAGRDGILVAPLSRAQQVREVVARLSEERETHEANGGGSEAGDG